MKKKILAVIVAMLVAVVALAGCVVTQPEDCPECPDCPDCPDCSGLNRIYDVNRDGKINFQDAGLAWFYIKGRYPSPCWVVNPAVTNDDDMWSYLLCEPMPHNMYYNEYAELLYDVNIDGIADAFDVMEIWEHRD